MSYRPYKLTPPPAAYTSHAFASRVAERGNLLYGTSWETTRDVYYDPRSRYYRNGSEYVARLSVRDQIYVVIFDATKGKEVLQTVLADEI